MIEFSSLIYQTFLEELERNAYVRNGILMYVTHIALVCLVTLFIRIIGRPLKIEEL